MTILKSTKGVDYKIVNGIIGLEEITDFRQTSSCFNAHEINPAIGCDFLCRYCSMYSQFNNEDHIPVKIYNDYPAYLENYIQNYKNKEGLIFNLSPKTDILSPCLIESGITEKILTILHKNNTRYYILTKGELPPREIQNLLIKSKQRNQIIISSGLPDEKIESILEPGAPVSSKRFEFAKFCNANGITVTGIVAPYLPIEEGDEYAYKIFNRYKEAGLRHASLQVLKISTDCLNRLCELLPQYEIKLKKLFDIQNLKPIEWNLPGGRKVTRYYASASYLERELKKLKNIAKDMGITVSTCKDVCLNIKDINFNNEAISAGFNCVGFTKF